MYQQSWKQMIKINLFDNTYKNLFSSKNYIQLLFSYGYNHFSRAEY